MFDKMMVTDLTTTLKEIIELQNHDVFVPMEFRETSPDPRLGTFYMDREKSAIYCVTGVKIHQRTFCYYAMEFKALDTSHGVKHAMLYVQQLDRFDKLDFGDARDKILTILQYWRWDIVVSAYLQHQMDNPITETVMEWVIESSRKLPLQSASYAKDYDKIRRDHSRVVSWAYVVAEFCLEMDAIFKSEPALFANRYFYRRWQYLSGMLINQLSYDGYLQRKCVAESVEKLREKLTAE